MVDRVAGTNRQRTCIEVDHTLDAQTRRPQSSDDFERLLLGSPNSSYLWIRYSSFYIQLADTERAREVLRRALTTINLREERERFNVWVSLLNLEKVFGSDQTLEQVFREATKANDSKSIHLRMASIHQQAGDAEVYIILLFSIEL
jgi:rRNA biogenesis protein RRP5